MSKLREELNLERRQRARELLIKEAVINVRKEQVMDATMQSAVPPSPQPPAGQPPAQPQDQAPQAPEDEVTVDTMIEKLNVIRGGTSFSDPEVYGQLTTFWNNMPMEARVALDEQLNQIGKVVSVAEPEEVSQQPQPQAPNAQPQGQPPAPPPQAAGAPIAPTQPGI